MIKKVKLQIHNHFVLLLTSIICIFTTIILFTNQNIYFQILEGFLIVIICLSDITYYDNTNNLLDLEQEKEITIENWNDEREFGLNELYVKRENAFKEFLEYMHFHDCFVYEYKYNNKTFMIYTNYPGIWIGKQGIGSKYLEKLLSDAEGHDVHVEFKELNGKFLNL